MKVITMPSSVQVINEKDARVLVCRWKNPGTLTTFRYHSYDGCWYSNGVTEKYTLDDIYKDSEPLALFVDQEG